MAFLQTYAKEIVSILVPILTLVLNNIFKAKTKLQVALPHKFTFLVQEPLLNDKGQVISPTQTVNTNSFIIYNAGKEKASNLQLVFNWKPMCINHWPVRHYEEHTEPDNRYVLIFDSLAPNEVLGIEVLSVNLELPSLVTVRSAECTAQNIEMRPQPVVSANIRGLATFLMALGAATLVYLVIIMIQLILTLIPLSH